MSNKPTVQKSTDIFQTQTKRGGEKQPHGGVGQDKYAPERVLIASGQPVTGNKTRRTPVKKMPRSQKSTPTGKKVLVGLWVPRHVQEEVVRRAKGNGLSISATGSSLLERALQESIDMEYGALLEPVIRQVITRNMRNYARLFFRIAFSSEQTRALVTNILSRQPVDVDEDMLAEHPDTLDALLDSTAHVAREKITQKSPQLQRIIAEFEQDGEKEEPV
jgi:hypothetical protein